MLSLFRSFALTDSNCNLFLFDLHLSGYGINVTKLSSGHKCSRHAQYVTVYMQQARREGIKSTCIPCYVAVCLEILNPCRSNEQSWAAKSAGLDVGIQWRSVDGARCCYVDVFMPANHPGKDAVFSQFSSSAEYKRLWVEPKALSKAISSCPCKYGKLRLAVDPSCQDELLVEARTTAGSGAGIQKVAHEPLPLLVLSDLKKSDLDTIEVCLTKQALTMRGFSKFGCSKTEIVLDSAHSQLRPWAAGNTPVLHVETCDVDRHQEAFLARHLLNLDKTWLDLEFASRDGHLYNLPK
eukprot:197754-Chlamydomonas_euryale.AAC.3